MLHHKSITVRFPLAVKFVESASEAGAKQEA